MEMFILGIILVILAGFTGIVGYGFGFRDGDEEGHSRGILEAEQMLWNRHFDNPHMIALLKHEAPSPSQIIFAYLEHRPMTRDELVTALSSANAKELDAILEDLQNYQEIVRHPDGTYHLSDD